MPRYLKPVAKIVFIFSLIIFLLVNFKSPIFAQMAGQIMVDPDNPNQSWLVYNRDNNGDGKRDPFFMCGAGEPEEFLYTEGLLPNYVQANHVIDRLIASGANGIYFQLVRTGGDIRPGQPALQDPFINHNPNTPGANIDLIRQWKSKWFDRLDQNGITLFMFIYDDGVSLGSGNTQFFKDLVNELKGYKHLIWVIGEESREALGDNTVNTIANLIKTTDPNYKAVVGNHQLNGITFNTPALDVFGIQYNSGDLHQAMVNAWTNSAGRYVNVMSESKASFNLDSTALRKYHWGIAMGGAYIMELKWWYWGATSAEPKAGELEACGNLRKFFESTTFNEMAPNDGLRSGSTKYVLANPGVSYIAYTDNFATNMGLTSMTAGTYNFTWYDIINNKSSTQNNVNVGSGIQNWTRPSDITGAETAVYIKKTGSGGPTPTPQPSPSLTPSPSMANQPPVAQSQSLTIGSGQPLDIQLTFEDPDGPGPYTYTIVSQPAHGTLTGSDNDRTYTSTPGYVGSDSFTWRVNDGLVNSTNTATVTINVVANPADADGDGDADVNDFRIWAGNYGKLLSGKANGDFTANTKVNLLDFGLWRSWF